MTSVYRCQHPATIRIDDGIFSVFARHALMYMFTSDAYKSMDDVNTDATGQRPESCIAFGVYDSDPVRVFDAAIEL